MCRVTPTQSGKLKTQRGCTVEKVCAGITKTAKNQHAVNATTGETMGNWPEAEPPRSSTARSNQIRVAIIYPGRGQCEPNPIDVRRFRAS